MFLRFIHVFPVSIVDSLSPSSMLLHEYTINYLSIHLMKDILGSFQFGAIMIEAAWISIHKSYVYLNNRVGICLTL